MRVTVNFLNRFLRYRNFEPLITAQDPEEIALWKKMLTNISNIHRQNPVTIHEQVVDGEMADDFLLRELEFKDEVENVQARSVALHRQLDAYQNRLFPEHVTWAVSKG